MTDTMARHDVRREDFDMPRDVAYLNCAYMAPLHRRVREAGRVGVERKAKPWLLKPRDFFDESDRARALFADLIGARPRDIALTPSVSYGLGVAAANLPIKSGQRILLLADQFPSNVYPWRHLAARTGAEVLTIPRPADDDWTAAVLAALDERVAIAALPNCHWTDGSLVDLGAVSDRCRDIGAALALDLTQSLGALPFSLDRVKPAFLTAAGYKWLMGPYSTAFLYVAPEWQRGAPLEHNWIARAGSENFSGLVAYTDELAEDASRFDVGERSNFALLPMAIAALSLIDEWGVANIAATLRAYRDGLTARAAEMGFRAIDPARNAPHLTGLRYPGGFPATLPATLADHGVSVSVRGDAIRVAPHLYNDDADLDRFFAALATALD